MNIERVKGTARTRMTKYTLDEAPPTREGTQRLQLASGAAAEAAASRGGRNTFHRGRGGGGGRHQRGRGNFSQKYSKRDNLQSQIYNEIDRQLAETDGPNKKRPKS